MLMKSREHSSRFVDHYIFGTSLTWFLLTEVIVVLAAVIRQIFRDISKEYLNDELEDDMHKEAREELRVRLKLAEIEYADHFGVTVDLHR